MDNRAKNQPNILDNFGNLFLAWLISFSLPPFPCSSSSVEGCVFCLTGCWRSLWPQITQYENSVHKISSRVLCIRRQGKMSHSAELRGERWNRKNWNGTSIPLYLLVFCSKHLCHNQQAWSKDYLSRKWILLSALVTGMFDFSSSPILLHLLFFLYSEDFLLFAFSQGNHFSIMKKCC